MMRLEDLDFLSLENESRLETWRADLEGMGETRLKNRIAQHIVWTEVANIQHKMFLNAAKALAEDMQELFAVFGDGFAEMGRMLTELREQMKPALEAWEDKIIVDDVRFFGNGDYAEKALAWIKQFTEYKPLTWKDLKPIPRAPRQMNYKRLMVNQWRWSPMYGRG